MILIGKLLCLMTLIIIAIPLIYLIIKVETNDHNSEHGIL